MNLDLYGSGFATGIFGIFKSEPDFICLEICLSFFLFPVKDEKPVWEKNHRGARCTVTKRQTHLSDKQGEVMAFNSVCGGESSIKVFFVDFFPCNKTLGCASTYVRYLMYLSTGRGPCVLH